MSSSDSKCTASYTILGTRYGTICSQTTTRAYCLFPTPPYNLLNQLICNTDTTSHTNLLSKFPATNFPCTYYKINENGETWNLLDEISRRRTIGQSSAARDDAGNQQYLTE